MRPVLLVAALCLTAGCLGFGGQPTPPTQQVEVSIQNAHDRPYAVQVSIVPDDGAGDVVLTFANGTNVTRSQDALTGRSPDRFGDVTDVRFVDATGSQGFEVAPDTGLGTTLEGTAPGSAVWLLVWTSDDPPTLRSWAQVNCRPETAAMRIDVGIGPQGSVDVGTVCASSQ
ncbi:hypothetical protein ACFQGE_08715 [Halomicroarcula sp. GCM10025817]|uniref:hypothetical protein n=1 Tax=Haloarcula TaxID=2237 RepID=UPI0023E8BA5B|nr:hypothetical protein [Halomicroarcula sp. SYNS111]